MSNYPLSLSEIVENIDPAKIMLAANNGTDTYDLCRCVLPFELERPTYDAWLFTVLESSNSSEVPIFGEPLLFYFYLATEGRTLDQDNHFSLVVTDYADILQVRMDTGPVVIIEDSTSIINTYPSHLPSPQSPTDRENSNHCTTFSLPDIEANESHEMVYVIAYRAGTTGNYLLQGAVCALNDARFPQVPILRCGIKLFANTAKTSSFTAEDIADLLIYPLQLNNVPTTWRMLFPYFSGKWPTYQPYMT